MQRPNASLPLVSLVLAIAVVGVGVVGVGGVAFDAEAPWEGPFGPLRLHVDPVAAVFLLLGGFVALAALLASRGEAGDPIQRMLVVAFVAGLALVPVAADVFTLLVGWELMSAAPGLLLILDPDPARRRSGLLYLAYSQISVVAVFSGLLLWSAGTDGTLDGLLGRPPGAVASVLVLAGVMVKAGVMPFHSWLPEAHAAAPSHVSALMSGVLVALPAYLVVRLLLPAGVPGPVAILVVVLGALSATLAALHALHERHLKRALALTTVGHMGALFSLLGLGLLLPHVGASRLVPFVGSAAVAYALTHGWAKGALFLVAGEIHHATGELDLERLGGLWRHRAPLAIAGGLAGVALAGLPPFAGFLSEVSLFAAFFGALPTLDALQGVIVLGSVFLLAVGAGAGLAAIAKLFLGAFQGPPRADRTPTPSHGSGAAAPALLLLGLLVVALVPGPVFQTQLGGDADPGFVATAAGTIRPAPLVGAVIVVPVLAWLGLRTARRPTSAEPWACGLPSPRARQTYTPQALVMPYRILFAEILRPRSDLSLQEAPVAPFAPFRGRYEDASPRYVEPWIHEPLRRFLVPKIEALRRVHRGSVHTYLVIALLALVLLLFLLPVMT